MHCRILKSRLLELASRDLQSSIRTLSSSLPPTNFKPKNHESLTKDEIVKIHRENLNPCLLYLYRDPPVLVSGKMQYVWDRDGRRYLDMFGGIVTTSVGHCHDRLVKVLKEQAEKLWHTSSLYLIDEVHRYAAKLVEKFPKHLKNVFFCNSGSEANELALLMARLHTRGNDIIGLRNCYHGCSPTTMSLLSIGSWKYPIPQSPGILHTPCPDPYRGRFGGKNCRDSIVQTSKSCECTNNECQACDMYIEDLHEVMNSSVPRESFAGFIAESIQGVGGFVQFPKDYIRRAYELVKKSGGVFIIDEVQTGFGRLGTHYWGFESHGIVPDIVTMAKGIGNGFPLSAVVTTDEIASSMKKAYFFNTFGGNPLASRVGLEVLQIIDDEKMMEKSRVLGDKLILGLAKLRDAYPDVVGDVRGKGLMIGIELIKSAGSREPISSEGFGDILENLKEHSILIGKGGTYGTVLRITPPMCINEQDADYTLEVIDKVISDYNNKKR